MLKLIFVSELIFYIISLWCMFELFKGIPLATLSHLVIQKTEEQSRMHSHRKETIVLVLDLVLYKFYTVQSISRFEFKMWKHCIKGKY